jgi:pre-mRNA-splicing factor SYF1
LEECFGSKDSVTAVYDSVLTLKIATPQVVVNYALYLESLQYFEESYKVYERGIELFKWPMAFDLWNIYLAKFLDRCVLIGATGIKIERIRDLFEMAVDGCPEQFTMALYLVYGNFEEENGMTRRAMRIFDRATRAVPIDQRQKVYAYFVSRVIQHFGLLSAREVYERAVTNLPDVSASAMCLEFTALELRLGEVDRARAIFAHGSQLCDPRTNQSYWSAWHNFEVKYGNEDTYKEMLRIKRSVQAQYNTEVNYIAAQLAVARKKQLQASAAALSNGIQSGDTGTISFVPSTRPQEDDNPPRSPTIEINEVTQRAIPESVFGKVLQSKKPQ